MSKSLVKKALALVEEGLSDSKKKSETSTGKKRKSDDSDIMPRHHKMVRYVGKKGRKEATDVLRRRPESLTVMEARKRIQNRKDNTEDNVRRLLLLSSANIGEETGAKLVKRAQTGRYVVTADEFMDKKGNKESAFDEEDFEKFEQELLTSVLNQ
ncbi:uncharacterized protein LOC115255033 [Aedes albopictus]|uniref:Active regulator of SIRT1 n=1 Tax=Aedes albopictus TaxID=7160 RepID=A0ABM1ZB56_AEDAL|nr:uncharacterized protein LOC115255033 [Aedes albopictus]